MRAVVACLSLCLQASVWRWVTANAVAQKLALWIDENQVQKFAGIPMDIFVIQNGVVTPFLQHPSLDDRLPILPPEVNLVTLTWQAPDDLYAYTFTSLRSLDRFVLYDPLLSIPQSGTIPRAKSAFQMAIPCTGRTAGVSAIYIVLHIRNGRGYAVPGSPLKLKLKKRCKALDPSNLCDHTCENGGKCTVMGRCECTDGFHGDRCHLATCKSPCQNGGSCIQPNVCKCKPGFYGDLCEKILGKCKIPCKNGGICEEGNTCKCKGGYTGQYCEMPTCRRPCAHGTCVDVNRCKCHWGWRGRYCNKDIRHDKISGNSQLQSALRRYGRSRRARRRYMKLLRQKTRKSRKEKRNLRSSGTKKKKRRNKKKKKLSQARTHTKTL